VERRERSAGPGRVCALPHPLPTGVGSPRPPGGGQTRPPPPGGLQGEGGGCGRPQQGRATSNP
jgi:hypothetical protein